MWRILHWTPRVLAIGVALFLSLFALDVFGEEAGVGYITVALLMHLRPTLVLLIVIAIAWRRAFIGGLLFLMLGVVSVFLFDTYEHVFTFLTISLPVLLAGILFMVDAVSEKPLRRARQA